MSKRIEDWAGKNGECVSVEFPDPVIYEELRDYHPDVGPDYSAVSILVEANQPFIRLQPQGNGPEGNRGRGSWTREARNVMNKMIFKLQEDESGKFHLLAKDIDILPIEGWTLAQWRIDNVMHEGQAAFLDTLFWRKGDITAISKWTWVH